jgi:uncharacterized protein YkwD
MTRNRLVALLACALALLAAALPGESTFAMDASSVAPGDPSFLLLVSAEQSLVDQTNADRATNGLAPVQLDPDMLSIARARAEAQLGSASLSHYDASGQLAFAQLLTAASVQFHIAGENLARASAADANVVQRVEQALMQSPTHRTNILDKDFTRLAIGAATDPTTGQIAFAEVYRD